MKLGFYDFIDNASRRGRKPRPRDEFGRLQCKCCRRWKAESEFYDKDSRPYVHSYCRVCHKAKATASYRMRCLANPKPRPIVFCGGLTPARGGGSV